ncbi:hypothetical protein SARC_17209, partial [Sphaeroforma arctica JP610]
MKHLCGRLKPGTVLYHKLSTNPRFKYFVLPIEVDTRREARFELAAFKKKRDCALVIDGDSLKLCMENFESEFIIAAVKAPSVVCCRCSPTQKADITRLVRHYTG